MQAETIQYKNISSIFLLYLLNMEKGPSNKYKGIKLWNNLPVNVKETKSLQSFTPKYKNLYCSLGYGDLCLY